MLKNSFNTIFVSLCGAPNVGKSTIVNAMVGRKVSIVSPKVQTTRNRIRGIVTEGNVQLVLIDTPGIFVPRRELEIKIVAVARKGINDGQILCLIIDAKIGLDSATLELIEKFPSNVKDVIAVINKIDIAKEDKILKTAQQIYNLGIKDIFMISAKNETGIGPLKAYLMQKASPDVWYYDSDQITDKDYMFMTAEITREALFNALYAELPYSLNVITEKLDFMANGLVKVMQVIYIQKETQKVIILGKHGCNLKRVSQLATKSMIELFDGKHVKLSIFVKIRSNWINHWSGDA